ncbi:MAG: VWA domain-containing protein, partial [Bdellovibrionales bacterium]|nr:VWA domain-containing protein [Bdellovibrionales bacterium]
IKRAWSKLDIGKTNLESASQSAFYRGIRNLALISDGFETQGNSKVALKTIGGGIRISPLVPNLDEKNESQFVISQIYAPLVAPANKSVEIRTTIKNTNAAPMKGNLTITHDGQNILNKEVTLAGDSEEVFITESLPSSEGIKEIQAILTPLNQGVATSSRRLFISGEKREKVLLISGSEQDQAQLASLLNKQAYRLDTYAVPQNMESLPSFKEYSVVILNNIARSDIPRGTPDDLEKYTKAGGGLIMIGGNRSFGLGGYRGTAIEKAMPVEFLPPETVKKRLNVAVVLVMDKSRSMSENQKIDFVKEAARAVIQNLKDEDYIQVIGFDASPFIVVQMGKLGDIRATAKERISRLFPAGQTNPLPALDEARRALARVPAGRKHVILLTDGKIPEASAYYSEVIHDMRLGGATLSTVMLGPLVYANQLQAMAKEGGGAFYHTDDPRSLPNIFLKDVKVNTGEKTLKEDTEYRVRFGPGRLLDTTLRAFPPVRGYVETRIKSKGNLELVTQSLERSDPLLASWDYGEGRALAFTSDANGRWSRDWILWSKFSQFWSEIIDSIRNKDEATGERIEFDVRPYIEHGDLILDLMVFTPLKSPLVTGDLTLPNGTATPLGFSMVAPGHYKANLANATAGIYELQAKSGKSEFTPVKFELSGELFGEQRGLGFNTPTLYEIASMTSGSINPPLEELIIEREESSEKIDLRPFLAMLALMIFLLEIFWREVFRKKIRVGQKVKVIGS